MGLISNSRSLISEHKKYNNLKNCIKFNNSRKQKKTQLRSNCNLNLKPDFKVQI